MSGPETDVFVVTTEYPVPEKPHGGVFIHRQVRRLRDEGLRCHVLRIRPKRPPFPRWLRAREWRRWTAARWGASLEVEGYPVHEIEFDPRRVRDRDEIPEMARALESAFARVQPAGRPVVYAHWLWPAGAAAILAAAARGWPVAAIARGSELQDWQERRPHCRRWVVRVLEEVGLPLANCRYLRDLCEEHLSGVAKRTEVIYNGCDGKEFRPSESRDGARQRLGLRSGRRMLLYCGSLEERKGIRELLEAWPRVAARYTDWDLVLVGAPVDPDLVSMANADETGRVRLEGVVPSEEVLLWMQAAEAYVHPAFIEGLPNVVLEAMATGLPVVTSDACGQREAVVDGVCGRLYPPRDAGALAECLESLMEDEEQRRRWGEAARTNVLEHFEPVAQARKLAGLLERLAQRGVV